MLGAVPSAAVPFCCSFSNLPQLLSCPPEDAESGRGWCTGLGRLCKACPLLKPVRCKSQVLCGFFLLQGLQALASYISEWKCLEPTHRLVEGVPLGSQETLLPAAAAILPVDTLGWRRGLFVSALEKKFSVCLSLRPLAWLRPKGSSHTPQASTGAKEKYYFLGVTVG